MVTIISVEVPVSGGLNVDDQGHEFTQGQRGGSPSLVACRGKKWLLVEGLESLATVIDLTAHDDELAHRAPFV